MSKQSGGILLYRQHHGRLQVLLGHPGGPFYVRRGNGVWSIPKGEFDDGDALTAAKREFMEETSAQLPTGDYLELGSVKTKSGKTIYAWAVEDDLDPSILRSNSFEIEWPPKSGQKQQFPEIDKFEWFTLPQARQKITTAQAAFLDKLCEILGLDDNEKAAEPTQASLF